MLSVLFATETCYPIKENNNKEKSFCRGKLPFCRRRLLFSCQGKKIRIARVVALDLIATKTYMINEEIFRVNSHDAESSICKTCGLKFIKKSFYHTKLLLINLPLKDFHVNFRILIDLKEPL